MREITVKTQNFREFVFHFLRNKTFMAISEVEIVNDSFNLLRFDVYRCFQNIH